MNFCFARMIQCLLLLFCGKHVSLYSFQNCGHFVDQVKNDDLSRVNSAHERLGESFTTLARVTGRVVVAVVVVRELFSVGRQRFVCGSEVNGYEDSLPHDSSFSSTAAAAFSPQGIRRDHLTLFCYVNIKLLLFFVD